MKVKVYMMPWADATVSFVSAQNRDDAMARLDELGSASESELVEVTATFMLTVPCRVSELSDGDDSHPDCGEEMWNQLFDEGWVHDDAPEPDEEGKRDGR